MFYGDFKNIQTIIRVTKEITQDTSTLEDPSIVGVIEKIVNK